jgi:GMP synthase-like glutamine amidotransferase
MKPIAVFQHTEVGAPGAVIPILEELGAAVRLVRIVAGDAVPRDASAISGQVFMGGYMGVHDDYPWIAEELALIRQADALGIPVAGHCLGSQLTALALGGEVRKHTRPEVGWNRISAATDGTARDWLGDYAGQDLETFQWHGDTFTPPEGAAQLARSAYCDNQMFIVHGRHLLVQSHLEMTPNLVELSMERNGAMLRREFAAGNPAVSSPEDTLEDLPARTARMHGILRRLYQRWLAGRAG